MVVEMKVVSGEGAARVVEVGGGASRAGGRRAGERRRKDISTQRNEVEIKTGYTHCDGRTLFDEHE